MKSHHSVVSSMGISMGVLSILLALAVGGNVRGSAVDSSQAWSVVTGWLTINSAPLIPDSAAIGNFGNKPNGVSFAEEEFTDDMRQ